MKKYNALFHVCLLAVTATFGAPSAADDLEPLTDILNTPGSLTGMASRDSGIDLGLAYRVRQSWGTLRAELVRDVGSASHGYEARLGYGYEWRSGPWSLQPDVTVSRRDARLNNYYYGVRANEATASRAAYAPGSGTQAQLGLYGS